jgi:hypothetical protein
MPQAKSKNASKRKAGKAGNISVGDRLSRELRRLQHITGLGDELMVIWQPDFHHPKAGEIRDRKIFIREKSPEAAVKTLQHEFVEYLISRSTQPYRLLVNKLIEVFEQLYYHQKEQTIEALLKLLKKT